MKEELKFLKQILSQKVVVHFDFDGTLAEWKNLIPTVKEALIKQGESLESIEDVINTPDKLNEEIYKILHRPGYYYDLMPYDNICDFASIVKDNEYDTRLLTCVINDEVKEDKNLWVEDFTPGVFGGTKKEPDIYHFSKRVFVPDKDGTNKYSYIPDFDKNFHILIDDHTPNCIAFENALKEKGANGMAIKMFNDVNGKNGVWQGFTLSTDDSGYKNFRNFEKEVLFGLLEGSFDKYPGNKENLRAFIDERKSCFEISRDDIRQFIENEIELKNDLENEEEIEK